MAKGFNALKMQIEKTPDTPVNLGIITGKVSQIVVVDIDIKKNGVDEWLKICENKELPETLIVQTGSGGYHYYFNYNEKVEHLHNGTCLINDKGIDFKTNRGMVVFPPSIHPVEQKRYVFIEESIKNYPNRPIISDMPDWLIKLLSTNSKISATSTTPIVQTNDQMSLVQPKNTFIGYDLTFEALEEIILTHLSIKRSVSYNDWIKVIWSIKNISTEEKFHELAHKFSRRSLEQYKTAKTDEIWNYGKRDCRIGLGSIFYWFRNDVSTQTYQEFN